MTEAAVQGDGEPYHIAYVCAFDEKSTRKIFLLFLQLDAPSVDDTFVVGYPLLQST